VTKIIAKAELNMLLCRTGTIQQAVPTERELLTAKDINRPFTKESCMMQHYLVSEQKFPSRLRKALERVELGKPTITLHKIVSSSGNLFSAIIGIILLFLLYITAIDFTGVAGSPKYDFSSDADGTSYRQDFSFWSTNPFYNVLQVTWTVIAVLAVFLIILALIRSYRRRHRYLCIYPHELVFFKHAKMQRFPFESIATFIRGRTSAEASLLAVSGGSVCVSLSNAIMAQNVFSDTLTLHMSDGRTFDLHNFWETWKRKEQTARLALCDLIEQDFVRGHLPGLLDAYDDGASLSFGALTLQRSSITFGEEALSWDEIETFQIDEEAIRIRKVGQVSDWYFCLADLPNACLLRQLVQQRELPK
jgi:hypothetical protein